MPTNDSFEICISDRPLKMGLNLSEIWIHTQLLCNRYSTSPQNIIQPAFHSLKTTVEKSFSIYEDIDLEKKMPDDVLSSQGSRNFCENGDLPNYVELKKQKDFNSDDFDMFAISLLANEENEPNDNVANEINQTLIPYHRCHLEEPLQKIQKRKKVKKGPKVQTLNEFLQKSDSEDFERHVNDDFYESCLKSQTRTKAYVSEFPSLEPKDVVTYFKQDGESLKTCSNSSTSELHIETGLAMENKVENTDAFVHTIVIENIPKDSTREDLLDFIAGFGDLSDIKLELNGESQKATFSMAYEGDVSWAIECLDGSVPFGANQELPLKCFQIE